MLRIIQCAPLTTVQDLGRYGYRHLGVARTGAADPLSVQVGNLLLDNKPTAAVLEVSYGPLRLEFNQDRSIVLMGGDFQAAIDGAPLLPGYRYAARQGQTVTLEKALLRGSRCYLCVAGGIDVASVLGSRSTDLGAGFGGHRGRCLESGDLLPLGDLSAAQSKKIHALVTGEATPIGIRALAPSPVLRALPGPEYESFDSNSQQELWHRPWRVSPQSNRMGLRLSGGKLRRRNESDMFSSGTIPGIIQVPPDGLPIILGVDSQTLGGYPRIATVGNADLWKLAYLPPGSTVHFEQISVEQALAAREELQSYLARLSYWLKLKS